MQTRDGRLIVHHAPHTGHIDLKWGGQFFFLVIIKQKASVNSQKTPFVMWIVNNRNLHSENTGHFFGVI